MVSQDKDITIRGLDQATLDRLEGEARLRGVSIPEAARQAMLRGLNAIDSAQASKTLTELAGTWTPRDQDEFEQATATTRAIEPDLWK